ncbi:MAG: PadR family transcriptional regulator [Candidatus Bathyarchaeia archaeon]
MSNSGREDHWHHRWHPPPPLHPPISPPPHSPRRNLCKHLACVPKGFLRFHVLWLLKEKPMSGSEIMDEIERETHGFWKPSPGSIYPLLAWLQDKGYIREVPSGEVGVKRYTITDQGIKLLEEQARLQEKMRKMIFFAPRFIWFIPPMRKLTEMRDSLEKTLKSLMDLGEALEEKFDEQSLKEAAKILSDAADKIEEIARRVREK